MKEIPREALGRTMEEFLERAGKAMAVPRGGERYLRALSESAFGRERARALFDAPDETVLSRLERANVKDLAVLLAAEPPAVAAALLAGLPIGASAAVLEELDEQTQRAVLSAICELEEVPSAMLEEAAAAIAACLPPADAADLVDLDGVAKAASLVNALPRAKRDSVLDGIEEELATKVRDAMFTFEDLAKVDARDMRALVKELPAETLLLALNGADEEVVEALLAGLSSRAAELIRDDLEMAGKAKKRDVLAARRDTIAVALRLEREGEMNLGRGDDE